MSKGYGRWLVATLFVIGMFSLDWYGPSVEVSSGQGEQQSDYYSANSDSEAEPNTISSDDRLAEYTKWLAILTGVLSLCGIAGIIVSYLQWNALKAQDVRLKESIDKAEDAAAQQSKDMQASVAAMILAADANRDVARETSEVAMQMSLAAMAMQDVAHQTEELAAVQSESSKRQLRAYIGIVAAEFVAATAQGGIVQPPRPPSNGQKIVAQLHIQNAGQTPAYDVRIYGKMDFVGWPFVQSQLSGLPFSDTAISRTVIVPQGITHKFEVSDYVLSTAEENALRQGNKAVFVHGEVQYKDAFGKDRWTKYRYFMGGPTGIRGIMMSAHQDGNEAN
jgi:hypothetical protein